VLAVKVSLTKPNYRTHLPFWNKRPCALPQGQQ
jgi:hypothetical protein